MPNNLTDNKIKKALERCLKNECDECQFKDNELCQIELMKLLFDLINRLQAENERLKNAYKQCAWERDMFQTENKRLTHITRNLIGEIKSEAYTEFAEESKEEIYEWVRGDGDITYSRVKRVIDNLLKKKVGEDNLDQFDKQKKV